MTVGEKIYTLRTQAGYSQEEFAEIIGVSRQSVSKWETSTAIPDTDYIVKICKLLQISTDTLLLDGDLPDAMKNGKQKDDENGVSDNQLNTAVAPCGERMLLSVLGFVFSFLSAIAGLILSCLALRREVRSSGVNHLAISGIAISCVSIFTSIIFTFVYSVMIIVYGGRL